MTPDDFKGWRTHMGYTQASAARELGLSREMIGLYEAGRRRGAVSTPVIIPRYVELACAALRAGIKGYAASSESIGG